MLSSFYAILILSSILNFALLGLSMYLTAVIYKRNETIEKQQKVVERMAALINQVPLRGVNGK